MAEKVFDYYRYLCLNVKFWDEDGLTADEKKELIEMNKELAEINKNG